MDQIQELIEQAEQRLQEAGSQHTFGFLDDDGLMLYGVLAATTAIARMLHDQTPEPSPGPTPEGLPAPAPASVAGR
ncbi:hypothetical protein GA0115240_10582 [Streptomyces sp. DvalAA-14]|uniref:hypothetical protein n=1 Tax=unclassified Streptomyces TaxID=2593676 RepID=UPI00081B4B68|nr:MULTISPECIES: hypothetical protein [unclassified Streptomyces]MYS19151.1 hypothetical protein [Streptomyces sp. SID4948]SCD37966.1 hypothetical protein GA0115240_10582 [Streptomyces sp. DvalAA-14]